MSITVTYASTLTIVDTAEGVYVSPSDPTYSVTGLNSSGTFTASTTPPVTKHSEGYVTLSSGSGSLNLAALTGRTADETVVGTGLKLQFAKFRNKSTNANKITVAKGASNGYGLNAAGDDWSVVLDPGQEVTFYGNDAAPDVASGARVIDVTGTGSQVLEYEVVLG